MALISKNLFSTKKLTWLFTLLFIFSLSIFIKQFIELKNIQSFNQEIIEGKSPHIFINSFEARYAAAYWLTTKERYKEANILFSNLLATASPSQKAAIHYNIGNIFFRRALALNGTDMTVKNETEYLFRQAKAAYLLSIKIDNTPWDVKHNLDRVLMILPADPTPGIGDSDSPGLILGNVPIGLP
jgi:tetratricopeptide (TPR) repeat protein